MDRERFQGTPTLGTLNSGARGALGPRVVGAERRMTTSTDDSSSAVEQPSKEWPISIFIVNGLCGPDHISGRSCGSIQKFPRLLLCTFEGDNPTLWGGASQ